MFKKTLKRLTAGVTAAVLLVTSSAVAGAMEANRFVDVPPSAWYAGAVAFAVDNNLFNGTSANKFSPDDSMTRGMFVTVLGRYAKVNTSDYLGSNFNDVAANIYYAPYVKWANQSGLVNGTGNGKFSPDQSITRQDLAKMMFSYAQFMKLDVTVPTNGKYNTFTDKGSVASYAVPAVQWSVSYSVLKGSGGKLTPTATATRAEVATLMMNFDKVMKGEVKPDTTPESTPSVPSTAITVWNGTMTNMRDELANARGDLTKIKGIGERYAPTVCGKAKASVEELITAMRAMTGAPVEPNSMSDNERMNTYWANILAESIGQAPDKPGAGGYSEQELLAFAEEVISLTNAERTQRGLPQYSANSKLMQAARIRAQEISISFDHARPNGEWLSDLFDELGYSLEQNGLYFENIAAGHESPKAVMKGWMDSEGHRASIIRDDPDFSRMGAACFQSNSGTLYWVQIFN